MIDPVEYGVQAGRELYINDPNLLDDSSDDDLTDYDSDEGYSGDPRGIDRPREDRMPRGQRPQAHWNAKKRDHQERADAFLVGGGRRRNRTDFRSNVEFILLEYMQNGSLQSLIKKRATHDPKDRPPNRVLWGFWLCCELASESLMYRN